VNGNRGIHWRRLDRKILVLLLLFTALSLLFLHSAGYDSSTGSFRPFWKKQLGWAVVSFLMLLLLQRVSYRSVLDHAYVIYGAGLLLLVAVRLFGTTLNNAKRWLDLGFMLLQPSEFMKVFVVLTLARYIRWREDTRQLRGLLRPFLLTLAPMALIVAQPDLGTALLFIPVLFVMLFVAGARAHHLGLVALMGILCLPLLYFGFMKDYQKKRVLVFLGQEQMSDREKRNEGYHLDRSKIAVGSGGLAGRGLGAGDQRVPENETDFIFTVIAEEWGFMGTVVVFVLYMALFLFLAAIAVEAKDSAGKLLVAGILALLFVQTAVNIGMTVGLAPITGLTLPFLSYGGSSLLSCFLCVGLALNVRLHPPYVFKRDL
jgi:rod shape determining protein RodA